MAETSTIEWTDSTWNPITGCTLVSEGCRHCYAAQLAATRLRSHPSRAGLARVNAAGEAKFTGEVRLNEQWLDQPLRWRRPRRIFVCAHGDLFHEAVPDEWIDRVFAVMALAPQHVFQVLTKRPERMADYLLRHDVGLRWQHIASRDIEGGDFGDPIEWTKYGLPNVWLGTSVEDQPTADARIPHLLAAPAAVRFLSAEPLLGALDLRRITREPSETDRAMPLFHEVEAFWVNALDGQLGILHPMHPHHAEWWSEWGKVARLDWVIVGGESGRHARPMHPDWARSLRDQCVAAGVPFFFKQWGMWLPESQDQHGHWNWSDAEEIGALHFWDDDRRSASIHLRKSQAGRLLDGHTWDEMPEGAHG